MGRGTVSVKDYVKILRRRWMTIFATVVLCTLAAAGYWLIQPSQYTTSLQLYVSAPATQSPEFYFSSSQLAQDRVESFGELARSPRVMNTVISNLQLPLTVPELQDRISATTSEKSVIIALSATDSTAMGAASIADVTGAALAKTVADLERPEPTASPPPLVVKIIEPAPVPTEPSNLSLKRLLALSLLLGLVVGVSVALLRHALDNTLSASSEVAELTETPDLGEISYDSASGRAKVFEGLEGQSAFVEDIKRLRTNIQFLDAGSAHKIFTFTSAMPNEGKTTTCVNLAAALASAGHRVLLIDADLRRPKIAEVLGLDREVGLTSVLARRIALQEGIQRASQGRFDVLTSGQVPPNPSELLASAQTRNLLGQLRQAYELILIDTSPLLPVTDAVGVAALSDGAIMMCRARSTSRTQIRTAANSLASVGVDVRGVVLTMVSKSERGLPSYSSYDAASGRANGSTISATPVSGKQVVADEITRAVAVDTPHGPDRRPSPRPHASKPTTTAWNSRAGGQP